ncbi:rCG29672 [Rattus norvegicus]|uniref:RCG29672 n=1 Tax=Rattus norvegicus TaxID=10116 RepID=A6IMW9_RAT|nr:rCG29672 [Rattus norvegicus]
MIKTMNPSKVALRLRWADGPTG